MSAIPPVPSPLEADLIPKPGNKIIHLIRHAQGYHNLRPENAVMHDPLLTPFGISQCHTLVSSIPPVILDSVTLLSASPLRRTLYTALYTFPTLTTRGLKVVALPEAQETGAVPADTGSDPEILAEEFKGQAVDLHLVTKGWNSKTGIWAAEVEAIKARAKDVRRWLLEREEKVIVLVTHGGFLHYLTQDWEGFDPAVGTAWKNCEWRTFEFRGESKDENVGIVETRGSRIRRGVEV